MAIAAIMLMVVSIGFVILAMRFGWETMITIVTEKSIEPVIEGIRENGFSKGVFIAIIVVAVILIVGKIIDIPTDIALARKEKEMNFANKYGCNYVIYSTDDLPKDLEFVDEGESYLLLNKGEGLKVDPRRGIRVVFHNGQWITYINDFTKSYK